MKLDSDNQLFSDATAVAGGIARSAMFAMLLPILLPVYLWDNWSSESEGRALARQQAQPAGPDDGDASDA